MAYCIMRMAKIKSKASLTRSIQHNTRERIPPNADETKIGRNWTDGGSMADVIKAYEGRLPQKVRKNAVHAVEVVMTASPEFSGDWGKYLKACDGWAEGLFGRENILHIAHHLDEATPHTQILAMPMKDGKLNAKFFIGGSRDRMAELQDDFFEKVGLPAGLERGQPRAETKARHNPHTLAAAAAKLEEKGKKVEEVAAGLREFMKEDPRAVKARLEKFNNRTPADLRQLAKAIEAKQCRTVGEFLRVVENQEKVQQQVKRYR